MLKNAKLIVLGSAIGLSFASSPLLADSFRCGTALIREGMPASEIRKKCGDPNSVETVTEPVIARRPDGSTFQTGVTTKDYWGYDRGPRRFPARVTIEDGVAVEIELLSRN
jgi:hypothetical protein